MRVKGLIVAAATMSVLFMLSACSALFPSEEQTTPPPLLEPAAITYVTEEVVRGDVLETISMAGAFTAVELYNLMFERRGGYIKEINIELDQRVYEGEILVAFDTDELVKQVAEAELAYELVRIEQASASRQAVTARENYERVHTVAVSDRLGADRDIETKRIIHEAGGISDNELDTAEAAYITKVSDIDGRVAQAYSSLASQNDAAAKADINLRQAQTRLSNLREDLDKAVIRSPIDGIITYAEPLIIGDFIDARKPVVTVSNDSELCLRVSHSSIYSLSDFAFGAEAIVRVRSTEYAGKVILSPVERPVNASYSTDPFVLIEVYDIPEDVIIGTLGHAYVVREKRENVIVAPRNAVQEYGTYSYVKVLEDGVSKERPVEVGLKSITTWEIVSGLKEGELIIVR